MTEFLKCYKIRMKILTPVHIGAGSNITKKEYIYDNRQKCAWIPDKNLLIRNICKRKLDNKFEKYMLDGKESLLDWMKSVGYKDIEMKKLCSYHLDCSEALQNLNRPVEIQEFMKDAYGLPYIPGSSLKGAIRTALLGSRMMENPKRYSRLKQEVAECSPIVNGRVNKKYLVLQGKKAEVIAFHTLGKTEKMQNALNDEMKGVHISDSSPLSLDDLVLCQKIDVSMERQKNALNILRECLKPGTVVEFDMTIDTSVCKLSEKEIIEALTKFSDFYRNVYVRKFIRVQEQESCNLYLGGGCGFATKTVLYELLGEKQGVVAASKLMDLKFRKHGHRKDVQKGVSPHMLKCTNYGKKTCEMGKCEVRICKV